MRVIREKSILEKIDVEIDDKSKPPIVRIDLDESEFVEFVHQISWERVVSTGSSHDIIRLDPRYVHFIGESNVRHKSGLFIGSYVFYKEVCVQCCYEEE